MAGHNKWSKIKHKKAVTDARKSKEYGRFVQQIKTALREAGGDATAASVRTLVESARAAGVPKNNIERALGAGDAGSLEPVQYEGYGPGGVALIIEAETDNTNRTVSEIKKLLTDQNATFGEPGSASWAFKKTDDGWEAQSTIPLSQEDTEKLNGLISALEEQGDVVSVTTNAA